MVSVRGLKIYAVLGMLYFVLAKFKGPLSIIQATH